MSNQQKRTNFLHHLGVGGAVLGMIIWFWCVRELGFLDWATALAPEKYAGAALMVAIMVMMLPALLAWKLFNRWLEKRLEIKGRYYEDDFYKKEGDR